jgi:hypothetical protein
LLAKKAIVRPAPLFIGKPGWVGCKARRWQGWHENILGMNALIFGVLKIVAGFALYWATAGMRRRATRPVVAENIETA